MILALTKLLLLSALVGDHRGFEGRPPKSWVHQNHGGGLLATPSLAHLEPALPPGRKAIAPSSGPLAVITFRSHAQVRGLAIRLADVALVESPRLRLVMALGAIEVGVAPLCGHSWTVSADYTRVRIRQAGLDPERMRFRGADLITVLRPDQLLSGAALQKAATDAIADANPGATVQITFAPRDLHLPVGAVTLTPQPAQMFGTEGGTITVRVLVDHQEAAVVPISFRLLRSAPAVVATRDLPPGKVLTADDLRIEQRPVVPGLLLLGDPTLAIGQQAATPIRGGSALTASMVKPAILVRRGTRIRLICKGPAFVATVTAEALEDGAAGALVHCRNLTSLRDVTGVVVDEQTAEVPF
jgi:flagellar basal body P-ring formation protein FlgA